MTDPYSPEAARALDGPGWLEEIRAGAAERAAGAPMPSAQEEVWRYSPIDDLDLGRFTPATAPSGTTSASVTAVLDAVADRAGLVTLDNGRVATVELDDTLSAKGVRLARLTELDDPTVVEATAFEAPDPFVEMNTAFAPDPVVLDVPAGVVVEAPVVVTGWSDAPDGTVFSRLIVRVGDDAEVRIVDHRSSSAADQLVVPVVSLAVGQAARVGYVEVQEQGEATWQLATQVSSVGQSARFRSAVAAFGGSYSRLRTECRLVGRGASGELLAAYFADGDQTLDFRTFQDHLAPDTTSDLRYLGAGAGHSRSVYTGTIRVAKDARGTDAVQANRTVKLSDDAWAESVPNLEILNNDVKCAHASAVGPVDEDQLFYLASRGVPPKVAERLIVAGFFDDVLTRLPVRSLTARLRADIETKLDRREA